MALLKTLPASLLCMVQERMGRAISQIEPDLDLSLAGINSVSTPLEAPTISPATISPATIPPATSLSLFVHTLGRRRWMDMDGWIWMDVDGYG
jgi:hypothetical protein